MMMVTLKNTSISDVTDYPISEAKFDINGNIVKEKDGKYEETGRTLLWSLKAGATAQFPEYVADYLRHIYEFLKVVELETTTASFDTKVPTEVKVESKPAEGGVICKYCGKTLKGIKGYGLHLAHAHGKELLK